MRNYLFISVFCLLTGFNFLSAQEKEGANPKIAVVDVLKLIDDYEKSKDLEKKLEMQFEKEEKDIMDLENDIKELKAKVAIAGENNLEAFQKELQEKEIRSKIKRDNIKKVLGKQHSKYTQEVYQDIKDAVAEYGKDQGFALVLKKSDFDIKNEQMLQAEILGNMLLYHEESMEITTAVLNMLNTKYRQLQK